MDILTIHQLPARSNARRKWLKELTPGDRVFFCTYTDYVDRAGYGRGEFEEGIVISREGEIIVQFEDQTAVRIAPSGRWINDDGDTESDGAWIIPAEGDVARQLRRILAVAHVMVPGEVATQERAHVIAQLRRMISGVNGPGTVATAERLMARTLQFQQDMKALGVSYYTEDGKDALVA